MLQCVLTHLLALYMQLVCVWTGGEGKKESIKFNNFALILLSNFSEEDEVVGMEILDEVGVNLQVSQSA